MLIRSQDKEVIVNLDNVKGIRIVYYFDDSMLDDSKPLFYEIDADDAMIAVYSTKEKAIKVLDMIGKSYVLCAHTYKGCHDTEVFQMPQDDEVEV